MSDHAATSPIIIVGAGPAGLAAARRLAAKVPVTLIDMDSAAAPSGKTLPKALRFRHATVFHAEPGHLWLYDEKGVERLPFTTLILAAGASDAVLPRYRAGWFQVGMIPDTRLAAALGCVHVYDTGSWWLVPQRDASLRSSVPGVYVVGAMAGTFYEDAAIAEGVRAARSILGKPLRGRILISGLGRPWPSPRWPDDGFEICPCSKVMLGEVRRAIAEGATTLHHLGQYGGAGAGHCRGRKCQLALAQCLEEQTRLPFAEVLSPPAEFPAVTIPVSALISITLEQPTHASPELDRGRI
jgi:bacterioferritin-associated ferredoxin